MAFDLHSIERESVTSSCVNVVARVSPTTLVEECFDLANRVGKYIFMDEKMVHVEDKRMAWILVDIDDSEGLPIKVEIGEGGGLQFYSYIGFLESSKSMSFLSGYETPEKELSEPCGG